MFSYRLRTTLQSTGVWLSLCAITLAQTPAPPAQNPAQRDATRPPGTEQRQPVPVEARPLPPNPTTPPGVQNPSAQTPPGTQPTTLPPTAPPSPGTPLIPSQSGTPITPGDSLPSNPTQPDQSLSALTDTQPRPVPPLPALTRLGVASDQQLPLTLNEAIRRALENNNDIEVARGEVRFNETQLLALQGAYDPIFEFNPQLNNSVRPVSSTLAGSSQGSTVTTTDLNNNFALTKQFARGGGNYSYFFNNTRETTNSRFTTLNPFYSASQGVTFTQPLWRNRAIDFNRRQIRIQKKRLEQSDADFRLRTIAVIAQVQQAYWDLVFAMREEQNQIANVNLARENFRLTEARVAAGASAPLERAEVLTELSNRETTLLAASQNVSVAENTLKALMLKDPLAPEWMAALVPTDKPSFDETSVDLRAALTEARNNRPELRRQQLQQDINDIDIRYFANQTKPRVDLQATLSTTGLAGTPATTTVAAGTTVPLIGPDSTTDPNAYLFARLNDTRRQLGLAAFTAPTTTVQAQSITQSLVGGYGQTLSNLFSFKTRNIVVGATIQLPLHNRTAQANLAGARIQRDQLAAQMRGQEQSIELDVRNAAQAVETSRRLVLTARAARANAELQLTGERRLYQVGRSTTFLLFQRENALVNARNQELRAETNYNKALAELQRATSTTLRANNIIVAAPGAPE